MICRASLTRFDIIIPASLLSSGNCLIKESNLINQSLTLVWSSAFANACSFVEPIKDMVINSTNRKTIAGFAKQNGHNEVDCWNIGNWGGIKIELYALRDIKAFGKVQDGIRIKPIQPTVELKAKPVFTEANFEKAHANKATIELIKTKYEISADMEILYKDYVNANP